MFGHGFKAAAAAVLLLVAACATPGPVLDENVGALRSGIGAAAQQSQLAFDAANQLAREQSINAKVSDPRQTLDPADFPLPAPPEATAQWAQAFAILDSYGAAVQSLVDPKRSQAGGDALQALGTTLNGPTLAAGIPASLTAAFSTLGSALLQARSESKATAVMRRTDAAFNAVVNDMATAIGTSGTEAGSLQNSVASSWNRSVLTRIEDDYAALAPTDQAGRRAVIQRYLDAMNARDKQLASLGQLRQSLLALGEAHSAAARGEPGDALFWVQRVNGWLDEMKKRTDAVVAQPQGNQQ
jgi:hypothetical protein